MKSFWQNNTSLPESVFDIIIVGGGIAGLSVAYWANRVGLKCLILEKGELAEGASGRNAGFLTGGSINYFSDLLKKYGKEKALELWSFTTDNVNLMKKELELDKYAKQIDYHAHGTISLFKNSDALSDIEMAYEILLQSDFEVEKVAGIFDFPYAYKIKTDASYDPVKVMRLLGEKLFKTTLCPQTTCLKLYKEDDIFVVETNRGIVKGKKVVASTNAHVGRLLPELESIIKPIRAQIAYFQLDANSLELSNYSIPSERIYFRKYATGVIMGGLRYLDEQEENTDQIDLNAKIQKAIEQRCQKYFGETRLIQKWSGIMGFTQDEQPVYGASKLDKDFLYLGGFSGHGNGYAFKLAKKLVEEYLKDGK